MPKTDTPGELATARLEIPVTRRGRRAQPQAVRTIEASIRSDDGVITVTMRTEPASDTWTIPLLAYLQFMARFEEAVVEALTK